MTGTVVKKEDKNTIFSQALQSRLSEVNDQIKSISEKLKLLHRQRDAIFTLLSIHENGDDVTLSLFDEIEKSSETKIVTQDSIRQQVISAVIDLIQKRNRPVRNREIMTYLKLRGISLGNTANPGSTLAAILSYEANPKRRNGKFEKAGHGRYKLREE